MFARVRKKRIGEESFIQSFKKQTRDTDERSDDSGVSGDSTNATISPSDSPVHRDKWAQSSANNVGNEKDAAPPASSSKPTRVDNRFARVLHKNLLAKFEKEKQHAARLQTANDGLKTELTQLKATLVRINKNTEELYATRQVNIQLAAALEKAKSELAKEKASNKEKQESENKLKSTIRCIAQSSVRKRKYHETVDTLMKEEPDVKSISDDPVVLELISTLTNQRDSLQRELTLLKQNSSKPPRLKTEQKPRIKFEPADAPEFYEITSSEDEDDLVEVEIPPLYKKEPTPCIDVMEIFSEMIIEYPKPIYSL